MFDFNLTLELTLENLTLELTTVIIIYFVGLIFFAGISYYLFLKGLRECEPSKTYWYKKHCGLYDNFLASLVWPFFAFFALAFCILGFIPAICGITSNLLMERAQKKVINKNKV